MGAHASLTPVRGTRIPTDPLGFRAPGSPGATRARGLGDTEGTGVVTLAPGPAQG